MTLTVLLVTVAILGVLLVVAGILLMQCALNAEAQRLARLQATMRSPVAMDDSHRSLIP